MPGQRTKKGENDLASSSAHQSAAKAAATQSRRHRGARGAALGFCQVKSRRWGPQVSPELASIATETQAPASLRSHARPPLAPYSAAGSGHAARGAARTQAQRLEMQRRGRQEAASEARAPRTGAPRSSTPTPSSDPTWPWRATHTFCNPSNKRPRFLVSFWHVRIMTLLHPRLSTPSRAVPRDFLRLGRRR